MRPSWRTPSTGPGIFEVTLPGERKLQTTCRLEVGGHALGIHAFVARNPDENHEVVYRWLLERNLKMYGVAFAVDSAGDIYLDGRLPLDAVTADELDRLLGAVLTYADESFNTILELGFASLDPQGVGVARVARRVDPQPRRVQAPQAVAASASDGRGLRRGHLAVA